MFGIDDQAAGIFDRNITKFTGIDTICDRLAENVAVICFKNINLLTNGICKGRPDTATNNDKKPGKPVSGFDDDLTAGEVAPGGHL